jgi:Rieske Fe-S protein
MTRREFLGSSFAALACAGLSGCGGLPVVSVSSSGGPVQLSEAEFVSAASGGSAVLLTVRGLADPILLVRRDSGEFRAVSAKCTHQGCRVKPARELIVCPCHGSTFDLDGNVLRGPAQRALPSYPTTITSGVIEVQWAAR